MKFKWKKSYTLIVAIVLVVLLLGAAYYIMVYRMQSEPGTTLKETNTDPVVSRNSVAFVNKIIEKYPDTFNADDIEKIKRGNKKYIEKFADENTVVVPGLKATKTLKPGETSDKESKSTASKNKYTIDMCTSMTPQGIAVSDKYIFISAYCHTKKHNTAIYVIDKNTHKFVKELILPEKTHAGGLAYSKKYDILWVSGSLHKRAAINGIQIKDIESYNVNKGKPIEYCNQIRLKYLETASFICCDEHVIESLPEGFPNSISNIYAGYFKTNGHSYFRIYADMDYIKLINAIRDTKFDNEGNIISYGKARNDIKDFRGQNVVDSAKPYYDEPFGEGDVGKKIQGLAFIRSDYGMGALVSRSYGPNKSKLYAFKNIPYYNQTDVINMNDDMISFEMILPPKLEQVTAEKKDNKLRTYMLFESGAYAYRARGFINVDRVLVKDMNTDWII